MAFDSLLNKPASEQEVLKVIVAELQANYYSYGTTCFFLKLSKCDDMTSEVVWIKTFKDAYDQGNFFFDTIMQRSCIMVKFHEGICEILCLGFHFSNRFEVWQDRISEGRPNKRIYNCEKYPMIPRELLEKGFGEISGSLPKTKRRKAV